MGISLDLRIRKSRYQYSCRKPNVNIDENSKRKSGDNVALNNRPDRQALLDALP
jgi:hypothetical protein